MKKTVIIFLIFIFLVSCAKTKDEKNELKCIVSILPQLYFLKHIGGDKIETSVLLEPGDNPHTMELTFEKMKKLSSADIFFKIGSGIEFEENLLKKIRSINRNIKIIDCSKDIELIDMEKHHDEAKDEHEHHAGEDHHHGGKDPHIWLSPGNAVIIAHTMAEGLSESDSENSDYYFKKYNEIKIKLLELRKMLHNDLSKLQNKTILVFHPSWGYFAKEFGLTQKAVEIEGKEPTVRELKSIIDKARKDKIKIILSSPQFSSKFAGLVAGELGARVVTADPLAGNYIDNLKNISRILHSTE